MLRCICLKNTLYEKKGTASVNFLLETLWNLKKNEFPWKFFIILFWGTKTKLLVESDKL